MHYNYLGAGTLAGQLLYHVRQVGDEVSIGFTNILLKITMTCNPINNIRFLLYRYAIFSVTKHNYCCT